MKNKNLFIVILLICLIFFMCDSNKKDELSRIKKTKNESLDKKLPKIIIEELVVSNDFINSHSVIICSYKSKEINQYDSQGILNYQLTFSPMIILKGELKNNLIIINIHSPGMQGIGHEENYKKLYLLYLKDDKFKDGHFAENMDFIKAIKLN